MLNIALGEASTARRTVPETANSMDSTDKIFSITSVATKAIAAADLKSAHLPHGHANRSQAEPPAINSPVFAALPAIRKCSRRAGSPLTTCCSPVGNCCNDLQMREMPAKHAGVCWWMVSGHIWYSQIARHWPHSLNAWQSGDIEPFTSGAVPIHILDFQTYKAATYLITDHFAA